MSFDSLSFRIEKAIELMVNVNEALKDSKSLSDLWCLISVADQSINNLDGMLEVVDIYFRRMKEYEEWMKVYRQATAEYRYLKYKIENLILDKLSK